MYKKLSEEEEILYETLCQPRGFCETMFSNVDNLMEFEGERLCHIRNYQEAMQSYEYSVAEDIEQSEKENFLRRKGAADGYAIGARRYGKSCVFLVLDMLQSIAFLSGWETVFASYDAPHVRKIFNDVMLPVDFHPCFKGIKKTYQQNPQYLFISRTGLKITGVNENVVNPKKAGDAWFSLRAKKIWFDEISRETETAKKKRVDAVSELGSEFRMAGMSDVTRHTPAGEILSDLSLRDQVINLPQFTNPRWDDEMRKLTLKEHKGENSLSWKMYVLGELIEDGYSPLDMERVRNCYNEEKSVKNFEITKDTFDVFENFIVVEPPQGTELTFISSDIGTTAPTEINIVFKVGDCLKYRYNITLHKLTTKQIAAVLQLLAEKLSPSVVAVDTGDGDGRSVVERLLEVLPKENIFAYAGASKIIVGFEKDNKGNIIFDEHGKPTVKEEYMSEWSIQVLKDLFYDAIFDFSCDMKFDDQISRLVCVKSGNKIIYDVSGDNHLFDSFKVMACSYWQNKFATIEPIKRKRFCKSR